MMMNYFGDKPNILIAFSCDSYIPRIIILWANQSHIISVSVYATNL